MTIIFLNKIKKHNQNVKMQRIFFVALIIYMSFFAFLLKLFIPFKDAIKDISIGFQGLIVIFALIGIRYLLKKGATKIEQLKNKVLCETLLMYAFIWMLITMVLVNELPKDIFALAG